MTRARLRPPIVVTLPAMLAVASMACGTSGSSASKDDTGARTDTSDGASPEATIDAPVDSGPTPQPKSCPPDDPGFGPRGKICDAPAEDRCSYPDLCPLHPAGSDTNVYACQDGGSGKRTWTLVSTAYVPACPTAPPDDGSPCPCAIHYGADVCKFGNCETLFIVGTCSSLDSVDKSWTMVPIGCNPPEPDASADGADGGPGGG